MKKPQSTNKQKPACSSEGILRPLPYQQKETNHDICITPGENKKKITKRWMKDIHLKRDGTEKHRVSKKKQFSRVSKKLDNMAS